MKKMGQPLEKRVDCWKKKKKKKLWTLKEKMRKKEEGVRADLGGNETRRG